MKSRDTAIDFARGFIVFIMPATHATLYFSQLSVQSGPWGTFLRIFAEGAGAPVFMFLLGFCFFLGRPKSISTIVKRAVSIFTLAYLLNFFKFVVPDIFGVLPHAFFQFYHIPGGVFGAIDLLMVGDIFQFAAISYLICGVLYHYNAHWMVPAGLAAMIAICSPFIWGHRLDNFLLDYLLKLFNGAPSAVFFPFFPWGAYPLLGLSFGQLYRQGSKELFYRVCIQAGGSCIIIGAVGMLLEPEAFTTNFYRLGPGGTICHSGLVLVWLYICHQAARRIGQKNKVVDVLRWCSINITIIYIIQWVVVVYCLPLFGFMKLGLTDTLGAVVVVMFITWVLVMAAKSYKRKKRKATAIRPEKESQ